MAVNSSVSVAASKPAPGGAVYYAPLGTALPTDATTALPAAYKLLGPISADGIKPSRDTKIEKIKEWDGSTLAALLTDESRSFELTFYGVHDVDVNAYLFGGSAVYTPPAAGAPSRVALSDVGGKPADAVLAIEMRHGVKRHRVVVPVADAVVTGEEPWVAGGLKGYTVTVEALKNVSGVRVYEYFQGDDAL